MTPLQIANAHCANFRTDGKGCLGAMIEDDLQIRRCVPKTKCVLATPGEQCRYFEECVAPMSRNIHVPTHRQQFEEAVRQYRLVANVQAPTARKCPACGQAMEARQRFCLICAAAKRRATYRFAQGKRRVACQQLTGKRPLNTNGLDGGLGGNGINVADHAKTDVN